MPTRQVLGILLAFFLILGGRFLRDQILLDDDGLLKDSLWLDSFVMPPAAMAAPSRGGAEAPKLTTPLPINTCSADSLTLLPGVGPVMAERIAAHRAAGHRFTCRADLEAVKGIGPHLSARLDTLVIYTVAAPDSL